MSFPERLKAARLALGMTQEQLGFELEVTKSTISAWENGRDAPGFRLLPKLKVVLGLSLDHLICGDQVEGASELKSKYDDQVRNDAEAQSRWELVDLAKDPNEMNNLFGNTAYASMVSELQQKFWQTRKFYDDTDESVWDSPARNNYPQEAQIRSVRNRQR